MMKSSAKFIEFLAVGNMTAAKELVNKYHEDPCVRNRINYSAKNQLAAMNACRSGNLEILKWIYDLGGFNPRLDDYRGFRISCTKGYLEMTQWIFDLSACDDVTFERTFIKTCISRRLEVCKWMIQTRSQLLSLITQELLEKAKEGNASPENKTILLLEYIIKFKSRFPEFNSGRNYSMYSVFEQLCKEDDLIGIKFINNLFPWFFESYGISSILHELSKNGNVKIAKWFVSNFNKEVANITEYFQDLSFHTAIDSNHSEFAKWFVKIF